MAPEVATLGIVAPALLAIPAISWSAVLDPTPKADGLGGGTFSESDAELFAPEAGFATVRILFSGAAAEFPGLVFGVAVEAVLPADGFASSTERGATAAVSVGSTSRPVVSESDAWLEGATIVGAGTAG